MRLGVGMDGGNRVCRAIGRRAVSDAQFGQPLLQLRENRSLQTRTTEDLCRTTRWYSGPSAGHSARPRPVITRRPLTYGKIYEIIDDMVGQDRCDVVIVGAGSAGCALAARLTEDSSRHVTLLEAGPAFRSVDEIPADLLAGNKMAAAVPGHPHNWSWVGKLTPDLSFPIARGRVLGGSSAVNGTLFVRGTPDDFAEWAGNGNDEWTFEKVLPFYVRLEDDADFDGEFHGRGGPVPVRRQSGALLSPVTEAFMEACGGLGFPAEPDKNRPGDPGFGLLPLNSVDGVRVNAAMSYLLPNLQRPNLTIRGDAFVTRVLFDGPRAVGVEASIGGRLETIVAGEVVLAASGIKSPHLLFCSGIGPAAELQRVGIPVVHDAPGVGRDFIDHPDVWVTYQVDGMPPVDARAGVFQASLNFTAAGSDVVGDMEMLCRASSLGDVVLGPGKRALQRASAERMRHPLRTLKSLRGVGLGTMAEQVRRRSDFMLFCGLQQGESRGQLRFRSADPGTPPELHYNYLSTSQDKRRMRDIVRLASEVLETAAFRRLGARRTTPPKDALRDDRSLDDWIGGHLRTAFHTVGTCRMGPVGDELAVVDQQCRVHGVENLRVVDISIMPNITRRGTSATAVMIGERASEFFDR
jgi:choline dehydrogenase